jgi:hypothetical protein
VNSNDAEQCRFEPTACRTHNASAAQSSSSRQGRRRPKRKPLPLHEHLRLSRDRHRLVRRSRTISFHAVVVRTAAVDDEAELRIASDSPERNSIAE